MKKQFLDLHCNALSKFCVLLCFASQAMATESAEQMSKVLFTDYDGTLIWELIPHQSGPVQQLVWEWKNGSKTKIDERPNNGLTANRKPFEVWRVQSTLSLLIGDAGGGYSYCRYILQGQDWELEAESPLGMAPSNMRGAKMLSSTGFQFITEKGIEVTYEVTNNPLVPGTDSKFRIVLRNGELFRPEGIEISGAIWGPSKAQKRREDRIKTMQDRINSNNHAIKQTELSSKQPLAQTQLVMTAPPMISSNQWKGTELLITLALVFASAAGLLMLWFKKNRSKKERGRERNLDKSMDY